MQNEEVSAQCLVPSHKPEQQSELVAHSLPAVLQLVLSGVHVWFAPQAPLQQTSLLAQALLSEEHWLEEQLPATQLSEQQSVPAVHASAVPAHVVRDATQPVFGSQMPEQQSPPAWQAASTAWHLLPLVAMPAPPAKLRVPATPALAPAPPAEGAGKF